MLAELRVVLMALCPSEATPPRPSEPLVGYTSGAPGEWQGPHVRTLAGLAKDAVQHAPPQRAAGTQEGTRSSAKRSSFFGKSSDKRGSIFRALPRAAGQGPQPGHLNSGACGTTSQHSTSSEDAARRRARRRESLDGGMTRGEMHHREGPGRQRETGARNALREQVAFIGRAAALAATLPTPAQERMGQNHGSES